MERDGGQKWNSHHVWSARREYRTSLEKHFRQHRGFVIPVTVLAHDALHRDLNHPLKPNRTQMAGLMGEIHSEGRLGRLHDLRVAENFFYEASKSNSHELRQDAFSISENLAEQIYYLADGYDYTAPLGRLVYPEQPPLEPLEREA